MTQQFSNMVERVALAMWPVAFGTPTDCFQTPEDVEKLRNLAKVALETSHHAELVEELTEARNRLAMYRVDERHRPLVDRIDALLAKIGGEA
jgi:hypothetical protein